MRQAAFLHRSPLLPFLALALAMAMAACQRAPVTGPGPTLAPEEPVAQHRIRADVGHLADDRMQGREAGTRGYRLASAYVAERMRQIGLEPAGDDGGWFQSVPLLRAVRERDGARLAIVRRGTTVELAFGDEFLPALNYNTDQHHVEAPAVFVGQAVHAPELEHDDLEGLDLAGKIAVAFSGAPSRFEATRRAFHSSSREKLRALAERGAIGVVWVGTADDEARTPWARGAADWQRPGMRLRDADGNGIDTFPQLQAQAHVSAAMADAIFAGSGRTAAQLFAAAKDGTLEGFDLPGTLVLAGRTRIEPLSSRNVVGRLPAAPSDDSDDARASEHVVYTAHLDHVGIGAPVDGDEIYNGALDNALGVAVMLESARELARAPLPPRRSMLFVALTAEEKGLLGAEWFARNPTVPRDSLVANINIDMPVLLAPSTDAVAIGIEHSSLKRVVEAAALDVGVALSPDPFPEEVVFVRSDQYAFVRAGIPAVYMDSGVTGTVQQAEGESPDPLVDPKLAMREFLRNCYHQPCDDTSQPIQYRDAARLARLNAQIGLRIGADAGRPRWNDGDFFGQRFGERTD